MPLNVIGTALQLQNTEARTLFYTFICSFYNAIQLLFLKNIQANQKTGTHNKVRDLMSQKERCDAIFSPFQILEKGVFNELLECVGIAIEGHYYVPTTIQRYSLV